MTPVRVVCSNTLNLALSTAKRSWSCYHTGDINGKMDEARNTLLFAGKYMAELGKSFDELGQIKLLDSKVIEFINELIPEPDNAARNSTETSSNFVRMRKADILMHLICKVLERTVIVSLMLFQTFHTRKTVKRTCQL